MNLITDYANSPWDLKIKVGTFGKMFYKMNNLLIKFNYTVA